MKKLYLVVAVVLGLSLILTTACGKATPAPTAAPTATVTVTKTAAAATVTAPPATVAAPPVTVTAAAAPPVTVTVIPTPPKLGKVRHSLATGGSEFFFASVAKEKGLYQKRGIDIQIMEMATGPSRTALFLGDSDVTGADPTEFYAERKDPRIIGPHMGLHFNIVVRKDSPYTALPDLKGKKIATLSPSSASHWQAFKVILKLEGLDEKKDFFLVHGEYAVMIGWLLKGDVEAISLPEPWTSQLLGGPDGAKARVLLWMNDLYKKHTGNPYLYGGVYTLDAFVKKNPDLARTYGQVFDEVLSYLYAHPDAWKSDLARKLWKVEDPKVLELLGQRMPGTVEHPRYGPAYKAALVQKQQFLADLGLIPKEVVDWFKNIILFAEPWY